MKLKKYKKNKLSSILNINLLIIISSLICSFFIIAQISKRSEQILLPLAKLKIEKVVSLVINHATDNFENMDKLYILDIDNNEIKMLNYNTKEVVRLLDQITFNIENDLRDIENNESRFPDFKEGVYGEIPIGVIFNNVFLNNLGPKIKLKFIFLGSIISNVETEVKPYGINNAYLEMRVSVTVNGKIILPFISDEVKISNVIPISINIIQGNVPEGYISTYK